MAADYMAERWGAQQIAIVHDGGAYGKGVAEAARQRLHERGVNEVIFQATSSAKPITSTSSSDYRPKEFYALYFGGYSAEAGLIIRQARSRGFDVRMIGPDTISGEYFLRVAGEASEGTLFSDLARFAQQTRSGAAGHAFRAKSYEPEGHYLSHLHRGPGMGGGGEESRDAEAGPGDQSPRTNQFDTLLGRISFDAKGDVTGYEPFAWYVWKGGHDEPWTRRS